MIRQDDKIEKSLSVSHLSNKKDIRNYILKEWSKEREGKGFRYFVETLSDGKRIYLQRPGRLNKGCDFAIFVENFILYKNGNDRPPKHGDLFEWIKKEKQCLNNAEYKKIINSIEKVYQCRKINLFKNSNHERILKTIKWFFIEQDITYWATSGRKMLFDEIKKI